MRVTFLFLFFFSYVNFTFSVNEGIPIIKNFEAKDYEGGSKIYSLVCTTDGLLYAGDKSGILEFDGEKWNKIDCGFAVTSLAVDSNNRVYVAGRRGIGKLEPDSTHAIVYKSLNQLITTEKSLRKFRLSKVFNVGGRIVYVLGNEVVINTPESIRIIESPHHFSYYQKLDGQLYFYSPEDGIFKLDGNKLKLINDNKEIRGENAVGFINLKKQLHVLISEIGIFNLEENNLTSNESLLKELTSNKIQGIVQLGDSTYALKTFYNGVLMFNANGEIIKKYHYEEGLVNNTVFSVFKDYWENLWIGTASGISVVRLNFPFSKFNNQKGIGTGYASILYKDKLFFATSQGLYYSENKGQEYLKFNKLFDGHVWGLTIIDGILYFGGASGIYSWDNKQINQTSYYPGGWNIINIPNNKKYFLTGTPAGIALLGKDNNNILKHIRIIDGINENVSRVGVDSSNHFWAEFEKGILKFDLNKELNAVENFKSFDRIEANNKLKRIVKYKNKLYFIADSGMYLYNNNTFYKDSTFNRLYHKKEFPSNILVDNYDRMWAFSEGTLSCYTILNNQLKRLSFGLSEFADGTYPVDYENVFSPDSNFIIIGQEEGFLGYKLNMGYKNILSANRIRKVIITSRRGKEIIINGKEQIINWAQYSRFDEGIKFGSSIKFYYSAGCSRYDNVKYSTFLYDFDKKWPAWNNETIKEYTNLPKGEYKFIVRSINKTYEESIPAIYEFKVLPPWYFTTMAKITYGLVLILTIIFFERFIRYRAKKIQKKIQKEQDEEAYRKEQNQIQENLIKQKEIIKLRNEKLRIDNLYKSKELANSTMGVIKKNQFLTELKSELEKIREYANQNKLVTGDIRNVIRKIDRDIDNEENWKVFEDYFDRVHEKFLNRLKTKYPILTAKDLRLCAYLRMNLSTKEIAPLMNITVRGVEIGRYRLRKKMGLSRTDNLNDFLLKF